jgi:hypothetical protein
VYRRGAKERQHTDFFIGRVVIETLYVEHVARLGKK